LIAHKIIYKFKKLKKMKQLIIVTLIASALKAVEIDVAGNTDL
jgi:hypothetical protein